MSRPETPTVAGLALALALLALAPALAQTGADLLGTRHNLSASGPGTVRALTETRICVFCHTPHNGTPASPLWNRELEPQTYQLYTSPTLKAGQAGQLPQPSGPTKLCLSCHDGTVAMGAVVNPAAGIALAGGGTLPPGSLSDFSLDLSGHHPVSFAYHTALPNAELVASPPPDLVLGGADEVHCITCHDPHDDTYGKFLLRDNRYSALCTACHQMAGWSGSAHATSTASVVGVLPLAPRTWPTYTQLNEWGCEACHAPHFAPTPVYLQNFADCTSGGCHATQSGPPHALTVGGTAPGARGADIRSQVLKPSAHRQQPGAMRAVAAGAAGNSMTVNTVTCADCHNPHLAYRREASAPYVSGLLEGVSGVDRSGSTVATATYEYEVCLKCHGQNASDLVYVPRVLGTTNLRLAFDPANPSYHPVVSPGRNPDVPSIPSALNPALTAGDVIYCTACHADDDGGSRGPHGSSFPPILRERYELADGTVESYEAYALCYRCHERESILANQSFRRKAVPSTPSGGGHSGHLAAGAPCAVCHDPHGVSTDTQPNAAETGDHRQLINFDVRVVLPKPGNPYPLYQSTGLRAGNCTLVCHGVVHDATSYP